jgi:hypothetical protein
VQKFLLQFPQPVSATQLAQHLTDLSAELAGVGERDDGGFRCRTDVATNSITAVPASIREVCRRKA